MHDSSFRAPPEYYEQHANGGFHQLIGPFYIKGDGSEFRYGFRADARHTNPAGIIHDNKCKKVWSFRISSHDLINFRSWNVNLDC